MPEIIVRLTTLEKLDVYYFISCRHPPGIFRSVTSLMYVSLVIVGPLPSSIGRLDKVVEHWLSSAT